MCILEAKSLKSTLSDQNMNLVATYVHDTNWPFFKYRHLLS